MTRRRLAEDDEPAVIQTLPLHLKYRPKTFKEVRGQEATIKSLKAAMGAAARPHAFMFSGPPGTGKTTLARILAAACNVQPSSIVEIDAASNSGIDAMRDVIAPLRYQGFGAQPNKMVIIDEAHGLSKQAFDSLLKSIEEPPQHVYFALCTTNPAKVPAAIVTRCQSYALRPCNPSELAGLLSDVCDTEGFDKVSDDLLDLIIDAARGSPRQALVNLAKVHDVESIREAQQLLEQVAEEKEIIDLCRLLISRQLDWSTLRKTLKAMPSPDAEAIRIVMSCYLAGCVMGARDDRDIPDLCAIAYEFSKPFNPSDKLMPLFLAFDRLMGS